MCKHILYMFLVVASVAELILSARYMLPNTRFFLAFFTLSFVYRTEHGGWLNRQREKNVRVRAKQRR